LPSSTAGLSGPSWFWPLLQPQLDALIASLGVRGHMTAPTSMRLVGGMAAGEV